MQMCEKVCLKQKVSGKFLKSVSVCRCVYYWMH